MLEHQLRHHSAAVELLRKGVWLRPDSAEYSGKLGVALASAGRNPEALEALDRAIELCQAAAAHSSFSIHHSAFPLAEAHYNRGVVLDRLGKSDEAMAAWRRTLELRPGYDDALNLLGQKLLARNETEAALVHLREAVRVNPRHAGAQNALGVAPRKTGDPAAAGHFRRAALLRPGLAEAHSNLGIALYETGKPEEAVSHLEKAAELRPDFVDAHWNLALSLLSLGDFQRGWLQYEWRRHLPADAPFHRQFRQPEWNGCDIGGRTLLVICEQGLGDTLQFIRYVPLLGRRPSTGSTDSTSSPQAGSPQASSGLGPSTGSMGSPQASSGLRGVKVIVECQPQLRELLATVEGAAQVVARGEPLPRFDAHVRLISLPGMLGARLGNIPADVPYLRADERRTAEWKRRLEALDERNEHVAPAGVPARGGGDSSAIVAKDPHPIPLLFEPEPQSRRPEYRARGPDTGEPDVRGPEAGPVGCGLSLGINSWHGRPACVFERKATAGTAVPRKEESVRSADPTGITGGPEANAAPHPFRVGIAWQGDPTFANDRDRSVPLLHFAPLAAVEGVRLYSLQKNHGVEQLAAAREQFPLVDFTPPLDEECGAFLDTAAVMANLDLVISSDTSLVHLAGALGVPIWMATSFACDWRWLRDRDDSPWYPTLRLFRQPARGDWPAVFNRMADALRETVASPGSER